MFSNKNIIKVIFTIWTRHNVFNITAAHQLYGKNSNNICLSRDSSSVLFAFLRNIQSVCVYRVGRGEETPIPNIDKQIKIYQIFKILIRWGGGGVVTILGSLYFLKCLLISKKCVIGRAVFSSMYYAAQYHIPMIGASRVIRRGYNYNYENWYKPMK